MNITDTTRNVSMENTIFNQTASSDVTGNPSVLYRGLTPLTDPRYTNGTLIAIYFGVQMPLALSGIVLNYFLLKSLAKVNQSTLKAKCFIQAMATANTLLSILSAAEINTYAVIFGNKDPNAHVCFLVVYRALYNMFFYGQCLCNLGLASDRLYAVVNPLMYHTVGYSKVARVIMLTATALTPLLLWVAFVFSKLDKPVPVPPMYTPICFKFFIAQKTLHLSGNKFLIGTNTSCFLTYMLVFAILHFQLNKTKQIRAGDQKQSMNIFWTYLLTNLSTLLFYLPSPLFLFYFGLIPQFTYVFVLRFLIALYVMNCTLQPIILAYKIPSIRENLPFDLNIFGKGRGNGKQGGPSETTVAIIGTKSLSP